ncbi:MAG: hypothetical protein ABI112_08090, partial [Terracoccus sp.]
AHVVKMESVARFTTNPSDAADWPLPQHRHLRLGNDHDSPSRTAERIIRELGLPSPQTKTVEGRARRGGRS